MSTFLELVNGAIMEAGKDQDDLTSGNFAAPPDIRMYTRFKRWVNQAYKEIQMVRDDWHFKTGRASLNILPAVYIEEGDRAVAPPALTRFRGQDTGFELVVRQVVLESGTWLGGDAAATIYFTIPETSEAIDFKPNEYFDEIDSDGTVLAAGIMRCKGYGHYNFVLDGSLPDMLEPAKMSFKLSTTGGSAIQANEGDVNQIPLTYTHWDKWQYGVETLAGNRGRPYFVTTAPDGDIALWPRPDKEYVLSFDYTKADGQMADFDDTPALVPERYHDIIMWMAVRKSGMYDRDRTIVARADEHIRPYRNSMERNLMPDVSFGRSRYNNE
jgi:hypothetical protein